MDNKRTLMHYLVETAEKHFTDVVDLADELLHVDKAARGDLNLHVLASNRVLVHCQTGQQQYESSCCHKCKLGSTQEMTC